MDDAALEREVHAVGRRLFEGFPTSWGGPLHMLNERAMELASRDLKLRAALFRFVDVVPACRSLDDLAAHLVGFVGELEARPVPLEAAMRIAHTRAGRTALGAAAAAGVRHMAHRFIVGSDARDAEKVLRELWRAVVGAGPPGLPARLARDARSGARLDERASAGQPADRAHRQRGLLGPRGRRSSPARMAGPRVRGQE